MLAVFLSVAIAVLTLHHLLKRLVGSGRRGDDRHRLPLPPSPWRLPWIGNLHQLGPLPHRSLGRLSRIHGPLMLLRFGSIPMLIVSSPEAAKEVLKTQDLVFASRPPMAMTKRLVYGARDVIFAPYGEGWRQAKKFAIVHVLCTKRVQSHTKVIIEKEVATMLQKIAKQSKLGPLNLSKILSDFAYTIITTIVMGSAIKSDKFRALVEEMSVLIGLFPLEDFFPRLSWLSTVAGVTSRANACFRNFDKLLDSVIEDRRLHKHVDGEGDNESKREDLVDLLIAMQQDREGSSSSCDDFIKPIILDLVAAGADTSFVTLDWAMSELLRNPRLLAKAKEVIRRSKVKENTMIISECEASSMGYVDAVVKETLRLHPPAPLLLPRESTADATVLGYGIPSRTRVMVNAWAIGRDPEHWEDPLEFRPERFLDSGVDYKGQDFHFLPFGSGRRMCPGSSLATATVRVALANLIDMFDWEVAGGELDMEEALAISARKKEPLVVRAKPCFD